MICKHFNLSYLDLRDDVTLWDYWCMMAEAQRSERIESYNTAVNQAIAFHNPTKGIRSMRKEMDRSGTVGQGKKGVANAIANLAFSASGGTVRPSGNAEEFARVTGRPLAYQDKFGNLFDKDGNPAERTKETIIVPVMEH